MLIKKFFTKLKNNNREDGHLREILQLYSISSGIIIDIGANKGEWVRYAKSIFPESLIFAFEPIPWLYDELIKSFKDFGKVHVLNKAVSDNLKKKSFNVTKVSGNSSFFKPSELQKTSSNHCEVTDIVNQIEVDCISIDSFLSDKNERVKLLKIDAQGAEYEILRGAEISIKRGLIDIIYIEIMFAPIYDGQASWVDICSYMKENGYWLHSFHGANLQKDFSLTHSNALFVSNSINRKTWG